MHHQYLILGFFVGATAIPALVLLVWALKQHRRRARARALAEEAGATLGRWSATRTDPAAFMAERIRKAASSDV
ncbi:hypothetical protein ACIHEI_34035 [Kitasatospora sp. NPDC051984]|uniref:hypothetical protein n=1 Tax=Kitasatospora sp. NPDC051984 TaxID=3364059 RepID=UPI0037C9EDDD